MPQLEGLSALNAIMVAKILLALSSYILMNEGRSNAERLSACATKKSSSLKKNLFSRIVPAVPKSSLS